MKNKSISRTNGDMSPAFPSLMNDFFGSSWLDSSLNNWKSYGSTLPAVNVRESNDDFEIEVAAPGMKRDNFKVELDNNLLTISSQMEDRREEQDQESNYTRREFSYQSFQRSFALPENRVKGEEITAKYVDGVLHVVVPKTEDAKIKPAKQIAVA